MYPQPVGPGPGQVPPNVAIMAAQTPGTPTTPTAMPGTPTGGRKGARAQSIQPQVQQKPFPGPTPPGMQYPTQQGMYPGMVPAQQGYSAQTGFGVMPGYGQQTAQNIQLPPNMGVQQAVAGGEPQQIILRPSPPSMMTAGSNGPHTPSALMHPAATMIQSPVGTPCGWF
ncbi:hypothetical protein Ddc_19570 [Ditylenchus destructor]|nr:hypothetical protein Ddc_19570 [Ditylenchus destructor]